MEKAGTILVGVDFSPCSATAMRQALRMAEWEHKRVVAVHFVQPPVPAVRETFAGVHLPNPMPMPKDADFVAAAKHRWESFSALEGFIGMPLQIEVGSPRDRLLDMVRRDKPDLLVLGAHSKSDQWRGIGALASACAQRAAAKVLIVRNNKGVAFRSVVACVEFDETSTTVVEEAIELTERDSAALKVLHVYSDPWQGVIPPAAIQKNMPDFAEKFRSAVEDRLRAHCAGLSREVIAAKPTYHATEAQSHAEGIMRFVVETGSDLVVLSTRGRWNLRDYFWGSTAERVVRDCACSALVVKPPSFTGTEAYESLAEGRVEVRTK